MSTKKIQLTVDGKSYTIRLTIESPNLDAVADTIRLMQSIEKTFTALHQSDV